MAIVGTDLKWFLSGGGTNTNPNASLGGAISTTQVGTNLFDVISSAEAVAGDTEYRAFFVKNVSATDTAYGVKVWIQSNTPSSYTSVEMALADEGVANTIETVADESTAPTGPTFDVAEDEANALDTGGNLAPGEAHGVWLKRIVTAGAPAYDNDGTVLRAKADTSA